MSSSVPWVPHSTFYLSLVQVADVHLAVLGAEYIHFIEFSLMWDCKSKLESSARAKLAPRSTVTYGWSIKSADHNQALRNAHSWLCFLISSDKHLGFAIYLPRQAGAWSQCTFSVTLSLNDKIHLEQGSHTKAAERANDKRTLFYGSKTMADTSVWIDRRHIKDSLS